MKTDELGIPRFSNRDLVNMIYSGHVDKCHVVLCEEHDDVDKFNTAMEEQGLDKLQKYIPIDVLQNKLDPILDGESDAGSNEEFGLAPNKFSLLKQPPLYIQNFDQKLILDIIPF